MSRLEQLSIAELATTVTRREIAAVEVTGHFLDRIARFDGELSGYVHVADEAALSQARRLDARLAAGETVGPLAGVPISVKDIVAVAGMPNTGASHSRLGRRPTQDAPVVRRLSDAGAIIIGKANCHELAFGGPSFDLPFPPARNPWNPEMFPGGSSSGSGVTVAGGLCLGSVATDTAGSIRLPATMCGMVGFKPGFGVVPVDGIDALAHSMDHCGPIAARVDDCRRLYAAMAAHEIGPMPAGDAPSFTGMRLGVSPDAWGLGASLRPEVVTAMRNALELFAANGGEIVELDLPPLETFHAPGAVVMMAEIAAHYGAEVRGNFSAFGEMFRGRALVGESLAAADVVAARKLRDVLRRRVDASLATVDAMLLPGALAPAGPLKTVDKFYFLEEPIPNILANLTGHPALAFPFGKAGSGMPLGLQIVGSSGTENRIFDIAAMFERLDGDLVRLPPRYFS
ncbi:amidase [Aminobacter sp. Y103A]|jgi:Asp-tRNA(Asn)/Glu-tRNA(Gln) amidotransferase A subunit family amidase|uniref:Indoleacetamide hydrolase n=1 Tax=Aminobacter aminovorans TaxID=83263 RepID=A0AAC8YJJ3_AMIAI|nr:MULTISPECIES: amidase [Aminobacter]AMS39279.1 amidase [Aminobacter aminovorans]MBB3709175.1 amidase [Aminobacter aminovorans]MRX32583.1 amidase [Aminobacter sp. MDW-2]QNH34747.1 amidase [Aminobacter sp. MDW-2]WMC97442.1 amidase [Aminobacter aminovorans]